MAGDEFEPHCCVVAEGSFLVDPLVGCEGPFDIATRVYGSVNLPPLEQEAPEVWNAVNTYTHIGGNPDLVLRLIHGRDENVARFDVHPEVSGDFRQALLDAAYNVELEHVDGASHGADQIGIRRL